MAQDIHPRRRPLDHRGGDGLQHTHVAPDRQHTMAHQRAADLFDMRALKQRRMHAVGHDGGVVKQPELPRPRDAIGGIAIAAGKILPPGGAEPPLPPGDVTVKRGLRIDRHHHRPRHGKRKGAGRIAAHRGAVKDHPFELAKEPLITKPVEEIMHRVVAIPG